MKVKLLTPEGFLKEMENIAAVAALTRHGTTKSSYVPNEVLRRIIKFGHESVLEHITLNYSVKGLSRACLHQLERHRHISLSVESTRHTLKTQLKELDKICALANAILPNIIISRDNERLHERIAYSLADVNEYSTPELPNDGLKYYLPEFWPTNLILTSNIRELRHIIKLRTNPAALNEFRVLAYSLYEAVPEEYRYLLEDCVYVEAK